MPVSWSWSLPPRVVDAARAGGLALVFGLGLGGCGSGHMPSDVSSAPLPLTASSTMPSTGPTSGGTVTSSDPTGPGTKRPMSSIPPPTMTRPTAPPMSPSDLVRPQTLVGVAARNTVGCVVLTTDVGAYELVGDLAGDALAHPRVKVTGMPHPERRGSCDLVVIQVTSVSATS